MSSQFGGAKNPPWARPPSDFINATAASTLTQNQLTQNQLTQNQLTQNQLAQNQLAQSQLQAQQLGNTIMVPGSIGNQTVYSLTSNNPSLGAPQYNTAMNTVTIQQQQTSALPPPQAVLPQPGIATPTSLASHQVPAVSYPAPRVSLPSMKQRVFTGTVTKLHDTFGFVDEEVFFQMTSVKGNQPKVGERVLVEAAFNASMPFKWNATRIQLLPVQQSTPVNVQPSMKSNLPIGQILQHTVNTTNQMPQMSMNAVPPPPLMSQMAQQHSTNDLRGSTINKTNTAASTRILNLPSQTIHREPGRFSSMKDREKHAERERERERRDRERNRESRRKRSPPRRSRSPVRSPPRKTVRRATPRYVIQIPKLSLNLINANVVLLKSRYSNMYIPSDFFFTNFSWTDAFPLNRSFKLGNNCNFHVMHRDVESINPDKTPLEPSDADHSFSAKVMLLSSASLEDFYHKSCSLAEDPIEVQEAFQHPTRLLQFLVGIRGKNEPMAIGGAWSPSLDGANPVENPQVLINTAIRTTKTLTGIDLSTCTKWYRFVEICYMRPAGSHKGRQLDARVETVVIFMPDVWMCTPSRLEWEDLQSAYSKQLQIKIASPDPKDTGSQEEEEMEAESSGEKKEPTHYSELDPKSMKIVDLRQELEARTISAKGLKSQLIARLTKILKGEQEAEEEEMKQEQEKEKDKPIVDPEVLEALAKEEASKKEQEEEQKRKEKKEKALLEKKYIMPDGPCMLVHPHPTAKGGKFDCAVMSLSVLLDYRPEDNKEHSFEVSLFAEMFNEMLMRDFGFQIYLGLMKAPTKKEEKDEKKDKDESKVKDDKKDEKNDKEENKDKDDKTDKEEKDDKKDAKEKDAKEKDVKEKDVKEKDGDNIKDEDKEEDMDEDEGEKDEDGKKEKDKKDKKKEKEKIKRCTTLDPALLLSFVYYDQNHVGYLMDKDIEDIFMTIGLQLSRAQIKKIVQRVVLRDNFNYRKITDGLEDEKKDSVITEEEEAKLCFGNIELLKACQKPINDDSSTSSISDTPADVTTDVIMYKGSMLNIHSLIEKLDKSEKNRIAMEKKMSDMDSEIECVKGNLTDTEQNKQKISSELQKIKEEMAKVKSSRASAEVQNKKFQDTLQSSKDLLAKTLGSITNCLHEKQQTKTVDSNGSRSEQQIKPEATSD